MKKTLPAILLGVAMIGIIAAYMFLNPENSTESIQIALNGVYLKVFGTDTANIYDETTGKDRFYRMNTGDYVKVLALLMPAG